MAFVQLVSSDVGLSYRSIKTQIDSNQVTYIGYHLMTAASESDGEWEIIKRTYNAVGLMTASETIKGRWDQRTTLGWTI